MAPVCFGFCQRAGTCARIGAATKMVGPIVLALIKEYHNAGESIFLWEEFRRGFLLLPGKKVG